MNTNGTGRTGSHSTSAGKYSSPFSTLNQDCEVTGCFSAGLGQYRSRNVPYCNGPLQGEAPLSGK